MTIRVNAMSYAKLMAELVHEPITYRELAEATGLHYTTVREYITALHKEKVVHIAEYNKDKCLRDNERLWLWGHKKDATRSKFTAAERQIRYRNKIAAINDPRLRFAA